MSATESFTVEITIDPDHEELPAGTDEAAEELFDWMHAAASAGDSVQSPAPPCPAWVQSIDGVEPTRIAIWKGANHETRG